MMILKKLLQIFNLVSALAMQNLMLRQQLVVMKRSSRRATLRKRDKVFWIIAFRFFKCWKENLVIVKPATVIGWHRKGFRFYWRFISRRKGNPGRPRINPETRELIVKMIDENPLWGAPRIHGELVKLGVDVSERTVTSIISKVRPKGPSQTWRTFLKNHKGKCSMDFFTVSTLTFKILHVLVILDHERRRIVHFNVTKNPTAAWASSQVKQAFPWDSAPKYLLRDRDPVYSKEFRKIVRNMNIRQVVSAPRSPWQNPFVERVIGSIRWECLDHLIILNRDHLKRTLASYFDYYNTDRTHCSLGKDAPVPRPSQKPNRTCEVVACQRVGGLHHRYEWKDAA